MSIVIMENVHAVENGFISDYFKKKDQKKLY